MIGGVLLDVDKCAILRMQACFRGGCTGIAAEFEDGSSRQNKVMEVNMLKNQ